MPQFQLIVLTNAKAGRDAEYNRWFDEEHMDDLLAIEGVVGGKRFRTRSDAQWRYCSVFDLDCEDPNALADELVRRCMDGEISLSDAVDLETVRLIVLEPYRA